MTCAARLCLLVALGCNAITGVDGYKNVDEGDGSASTDATSAGDGEACTVTCLSTAASCASACKKTQAQCHVQCGGNPGCDKKCDPAAANCLNACASSCAACGCSGAQCAPVIASADAGAD